MICTHCGLDSVRYQKMEKVVKAAEKLIAEGGVDDNTDGIVEATTKLIGTLADLQEAKTGGPSVVQ